MRIRLAHVVAGGVVTTAVPGIAGAQTPDTIPAVICASKAGERQRCDANTRRGVQLLRSVGVVTCERGKTWGYDERTIWVSDGCSGEFALGSARRAGGGAGTYTPLSGFTLVDSDRGDFNLKLWVYFRYLNQLSLRDSYVDHFGDTIGIDPRNDVQFQKVNIQFLGWILHRSFRYYVYIWTANTSQGLGAQVAVNGNLTYVFGDGLSVAGGIGALPGVRSTEGSYPHWLTVDNRMLADEFFRPSYTMGIWAQGKVLGAIGYHLMLGNNLSQFGVDAGRLDAKMNTWSGALVWMPTTGEFGTNEGFGDFDYHKRAATRIGIHATTSGENAEGQPGEQGFENVQLRLSDGTVIFIPDLFGPGIRVDDARYRMLSIDAAVKYRGFSVEGEYYWRTIDQMSGPGTAGLPELRDHGFQIQASAMLVPKKLQMYVAGSKVLGQFGDPTDARLGVNWYPFASQVARWNVEYLRIHRSPVGALALPYVVGGTGPVFYASFAVNF